ncbi:MAG: autotransporter domain-containing protein, partial [Pseudomonadota bacterium]
TIGIGANQLNGDGDLIITTGAGSEVIGNTNNAIRAFASNNGDVRITVNGTVSSLDNTGISAEHGSGGEIFITSKPGSEINAGIGGGDMGIETMGGPTTLIVAGTVNGGDAGAIQFDQVAALDDRLELRPGFVITDNGSPSSKDTVLAGPGDDTLAFGGAGDGDFDLSKIDTGAMTKQFQNFENFQVESGTWSFSGATNAVFTQRGGVLGGNPTFGGLVVEGGTLAPGSSFGTVTVNGAFSMAAASTLEIEVNAAGKNDKVMVNGTVNLTGATLSVLAANGNYKPKTEYTIIENDGSDKVKGVFGKITSSLAFLTPSVDYKGGTGNDVVLILERSETLFPDVARTRNEKAVAGALSKFPSDNPLFLAVLNQTAAGARQAFNALSGEIHATVAGTLADDSRYTREAVMGRMMQASHRGSALGSGGPETASYDDGAYRLGGADAYDGKSLVAPVEPAPIAFWTEGFGAWGDFDGNGNAADADRNLGGFISGMDADIGDALGGSWRAGFALGASFSDVDVDARLSSADVDTFHLGGYLGGEAHGFALRGGGLWAFSEIDTSRAVAFPNFFERQKANYDADTGQIFGEIAYPTQAMGLALEPFAGLAYVNVDTDSFREKGEAQARLRGGNFDQDVGYTTLGLRVARTMLWGAMEITPHLSAAWQHAFNGTTPDGRLAFATTGIGFTVAGVPLAEDTALLDAGLDLAVSD